MPVNAQIGVKDETTYGTAVTVDRFYEFTSESIESQPERIESASLRTGTYVQRSDRWAPNFKGAAGSVEFEVMTKGFGWWLKHMLGTTATAGPTDSAYTHTGTIGSLTGDSFTLQTNRQLHVAAGTDQAYTYEGGKVTSWELSCDVDGVLTASVDCDFENETTATALAVASYPTGMELFSFVGGAVTIGGSSVPVTTFKVACDNGLKTDRFYLRGNSLKLEPVQDGPRDITFEVACDFDSLTQYNRVRAATTAAATAQIVATFTGPTLIGTSTYPTVTVTLPACRFDGKNPSVSSMEPLSQELSGKVLFDGTNSAVTVAYVSADTTA